MVAAPHTSNWDFPIAVLSFWVMGLDVKFFIKDDYTKGPFGFLFKALGALGVDRSKAKNGLTDYAIELLKANKNLIIIVPAEGTRKRVDKWRTGFYRIALEANVPVSLGYLDYEKKIAGVADVFFPTGDFEKDMTHIQEVYRPIKGKNPENYNPRIF
jgi:1-acyl-sn-glycerol-3-phosphate acyltransferase